MLSEQDIRDNYIEAAIKQTGWDPLTQVRREVYVTKQRE